jgi:AcrR family transcriptional regulator
MSSKREQIKEAALRLFCENGFQYTSTANISKQAGVATGTLFVYFPTKEVLINTLYKEAKQDLAQFLQEDLREEKDTKTTIKHIWLKAHAWALSNMYAFRFIHMYASSPFISQVTREEIASTADFAQHIIKKAITEGVITQMDISLFFQIFDGLWTSTINYIATLEKAENSDYIIEQAFEIFWKGVSK